jgi:hypothetical protein
MPDALHARIVPASRLSDDAYHADRSHVSSSTLKAILKSPLHYRWALANPRTPTKAMRLGTLIHAAVLEPERFAREFAVAPPLDLRTKAGKAALEALEAENPGKTVIFADDFASIERVRSGLAAHETARALLELRSEREESVFWTDPETGAPCKSRKDLRVDLDDGLIVDLKKTSSAERAAFARQVANLHYDLSAVMYTLGDAMAYGVAPQFVWVCVEEDTGAVGVYRPDEDFRARGRKNLRHALRLLAECRERDTWPGYQDGLSIETVSPPRWAA